PAYNRPTQEGLFRHFAAVAEASSKPLILYNVPSRTAVDMMPPTIARLSQLERVRAVKEAVPELERVRELVATSSRTRSSSGTASLTALTRSSCDSRAMVGGIMSTAVREGTL